MEVRDIRAPGTGGSSIRFFYYNPEIGPEFVKRLFCETDMGILGGQATFHSVGSKNSMSPCPHPETVVSEKGATGGGDFFDSGFRPKIEPVDLSWVPHPAQRVGAERLETAAVADHRGKLGRHEHLATQGLTQGLDARDFVDRRPDYRKVEAVDGADIAIEYLPEMEREVDRGNWLAGLLPRGIEPIETIHRFRRGIESLAAGLIPRRIDEGKGREHAVAEEFQHLAAARAQ
jgi:hypothetical protein